MRASIPIENRKSSLILVVDDDPVGARCIAGMVASIGHRAIVAGGWTEAVWAFKKHPVDLVLMDAVMPKVDGFGLTRLLRGRAASYVPIVFVTGLSDGASRARCVDAGADDLITKPVDPVELAVRLRAMLRIRELTQALEERTRSLGVLANGDELTGLGNRRSFDEQLASELSRANRYDRPLALAMFDLDHFKQVNDAFGHDAGDEVLRFVGELVRETIRRSDAAFRYGGEEFAILMPETSAEAAALFGERLLAAFAARTVGVCRAGRQTFSMGVSCTTQLTAPVEVATIVRTADAALYRAKHQGRARVVLWEPPAARSRRSARDRRPAAVSAPVSRSTPPPAP